MSSLVLTGLVVLALLFAGLRGLDNVPLSIQQAAALSELYRGMNCSDPTSCPVLPNNRVCPDLGWSQYSMKLDCEDGSVTVIGLCLNEIKSGGSLSSIGHALSVLTHLRTLYIIDNYGAVSGTIPTEIGLLHELELLNLAYNSISGTLPTELGNLSNLIEMRIQSTYISGSIPTQLSRLTNLLFLHLDHNRLEGFAPRLEAFPLARDNVAMSADTFECLLVSSDGDETNCLTGCANEPRCCATQLCGRRANSWRNLTTTTPPKTAMMATTAVEKTTATTTTTPSQIDTTTVDDSLQPTSSSVFVVAMPSQMTPAAADVAVLVGAIVGAVCGALLLAVLVALLILRRRRGRLGQSVDAVAQTAGVPSNATQIYGSFSSHALAPARSEYDAPPTLFSNYDAVDTPLAAE
jgi:hypothetical protein